MEPVEGATRMTSNMETRAFLHSNFPKWEGFRKQAHAYGMEFYYNRKKTSHPTYCSVCGLPIKKESLQIEFMAGRVKAGAVAYLHHIHRDCFLLELKRLFGEWGQSLEEAISSAAKPSIEEYVPKAVLERLR